MGFIKEITTKETYVVRHPVLRVGKPLEDCRFECDDLKTTIHFGLYENEILVAVISLFESNNSIFNKENQYQIRGMAVLENHQKKGFGKALICHIENYLFIKNKSFIWFNAREIAIGFYEKLGYRITGNPFSISDVGIHFVMFKNLT